MPLLSESDAQRLEGLIDAIEAQTSAEIVVIEAGACGDWALQRAWLAGAAVLGLGSALVLVFPGIPAAWLLALEAGMAPLAWWVASRPELLSRIIPARSARAAVEARAHQLFTERGLYRTSARSGILILVADLERRVAIQVDAGVSARLGNERWHRDVDAIAAAIRAGRTADGIAGVIEQLGEKLAVALPRGEDDSDELSDAVHRID